MRVMTGVAFGSNFEISGCSMSAGSSFRILSIRSRTSCAATSTDCPSWNSSVIWQTFSMQVVFMVLSPSMVPTASSRRLATSTSISAGLAPG